VAVPWPDVFGPARAVAYDLIRGQDPELAAELHDQGYAGSHLRPLGVSAPCFRGARKKAGVYATSDDGALWFGSPVPRIATAILTGLAARREIRWGSVVLGVKGVLLEPPPECASGEMTVSTVTPVLIKFEDRYIFPDHPRFVEYLVRNLRHKAELLKLSNQVEAEVVSSGPPRKFLVQGAPRHGCTMVARISAAPELLLALHEWGLGLCTNQGFGWIR
jgi:CRISPR-associated endoribonuclease Cas6